MVRIQWLGHAAFLLESASKTVIIDPWLNPRPRDSERLVPPALTADRVRKADLVLVTHEHYDHADPFDVATICGRTNAHVAAPEETLAKFGNVNPRLKVSVEEGNDFNVAGVDIHVVPARHPQSSHPVGFIVTLDGKRVYHAGDTYDFSAMSQFDCDAAMLPIGGTYTMDVLASITALKLMRARVALPMHYNTFRRIEADSRDWSKRVAKDTHSEPVVLDLGESVTI